MIRRAVLNDSEAIAEIIIKAWKTAYENIIDPGFPQTMKKDTFVKIMENNIKNELEIIYVYEEDGIINGFISGRTIENSKYDCETVGLYVLPDYQGNGTGSALLEEMKECFRKSGCCNMIIWTLWNAENNRFYRKHKGEALEFREIEIGGRNYSGAGFVFIL